MPKWALLGLLLAPLVLPGLVPDARADGLATPSCGAPGKPACPMQHWMRRNLATALAHKDLKALATAFDALLRLNPEPEKWKNWDKFARDGARAARNGRARGAIVACAHCHSIYRPEYNAKYRTRVIAQ